MAKANPQKKAAAVAAKKKKSSDVKHKVSRNGTGLSGAALTILNKAAALKTALGHNSLERTKLTALTGIHGKSTIANALTKLKNDDLMLVTPEEITITDLGLEMANPAEAQAMLEGIPITNAQYHKSVKEQYKLKPKQIEFFDFIADGKIYHKEEVAKRLGMKMNSTFFNLLTSLKKFGIIEYDSKTVRLTDTMMPFEPRFE